MKQLKETPIENAFQIRTIISIHRGHRLREHPPTGPAAARGGVVYDFWQLLFLESGRYHCRIEGSPPQVLEKGHLLICEPRRIRFSSENSDAVVSIINIRCASPRLKEMKNRALSLSEPELAAMTQILELGGSIFRQVPPENPFRGQQPQEGTADWQLQFLKNHIELLLIGLYGRFRETRVPRAAGQDNSYEARFFRIRQYLQEHLREPLTVSQICGAMSCSESTLKRTFESQADCGVIHYFLLMKLEEAGRLLKETDMTVTEVSEALGFSSVHYFSRLFKRCTGHSPRGFCE